MPTEPRQLIYLHTVISPVRVKDDDARHMTTQTLQQQIGSALERDGYCIANIRDLDVTSDTWFDTAKEAAKSLGRACATGSEGDNLAAFLSPLPTHPTATIAH
ncbi:hypothetical protein [Microbacterium phyllosphaerae]|uniref:hypothetical protein n=1 Tax=Microbacterium phyllosphaerae TaxID=124798 RepID=UPI002167E902|nr:hypothetical protein [Microbacterium phyllosphaerae]MCS3442190.1 hypothetical protein [Microbacterium phyllosphaerae]